MVQNLKLSCKRPPLFSCCFGGNRPSNQSDTTADMIELDVPIRPLNDLDLLNLNTSTMFVFGRQQIPPKRRFLMFRGLLSRFLKRTVKRLPIGKQDNTILLDEYLPANLDEFFSALCEYTIDGNGYDRKVVYKDKKFGIYSFPIFNKDCHVIGGLIVVKPFEQKDDVGPFGSLHASRPHTPPS